MNTKLLSVIPVLVFSAIPMMSYASVVELSAADCNALSKPHTVVVLYDDGCSHCHNFLPIYESVSNEPAFSGWTFYKHEINSGNLCGKSVAGVPVIYINNMTQELAGETDAQTLEKFLQG